jgi:hypothetical protein
VRVPLPGTNGVKDSGNDALRLTIDYVKQESLGPLKATGRFVAAGLAATLLWSVGLVLLLVGLLRLLQTETGSALTGDWSWVPYVVVSVFAVAVVAIAVWRITAGPATPRLPKVEARIAARERAGTAGPSAQGGTAP